MNNFSNILDKVKSPLTLAGLVVLCLTFIYKQIFSMQIFPVLTDESATLTINSAIDKLFYLALVSSILGGFSYIWLVYQKKKK